MTTTFSGPCSAPSRLLARHSAHADRDRARGGNGGNVFQRGPGCPRRFRAPCPLRIELAHSIDEILDANLLCTWSASGTQILDLDLVEVHATSDGPRQDECLACHVESTQIVAGIGLGEAVRLRRVDGLGKLARLPISVKIAPSVPESAPTISIGSSPLSSKERSVEITGSPAPHVAS